MRSRLLTFAWAGILMAGVSAAGCLGNHDLERLSKAQASSMDSLLWPTDYCRAFNWYDDGACDSFCPEPDGDCLAVMDTCGPWQGWRCRDDRLCDRHACDVDSFGYCIELNQDLDDGTPVCGCDGRNYASEGERLRAGVARRHLGRCQASIPECGPWPGSGCSANQICDIHSCGDAAGGDCVELPQACTPQFQPVCGCDGTTYTNDCLRLMAGVALDHHGQCRDQSYPCGPWAGGACPAGLVCDIRSCQPAVGGICVSKSALRSGSNISPTAVCGCDGNSYETDLDRIQAGVALDYPGECLTDLACDATNSDSCPESMLCNLLGCGPEAVGQCTSPVMVCLDSTYPVCGCDAQTYLNDCLRIQAGVALDHPGECQPPIRSCGPWEGGECDQGMVCNLLTCDENTGGECVRQPDICPSVYNPVCGCNGVTYGNDCARLMEGTPLRHEGACEIP